MIPSFASIKSVAEGAVKKAALLADTGIFDNVPIVSNVLNIASTIAEVIEGREATDEVLQQCQSLAFTVVPVLDEVGKALEQGVDVDGADGLRKALAAMEVTLEAVQAQVDVYINTYDGTKYAAAAHYEDELKSGLSDLDRQLHLVSVAITGGTYVEVLRNGQMLEELQLGVFGTNAHIEELQASMATKEQVAAMNEKLDAIAASSKKQDRRQRAKSDRNAALEQAEIPAEELELDPELFAQGGFAAVYMVKWVKEVCVAKIISTRNMTLSKRKSLEGGFLKEVAIMKDLKHPSIVRIWGCCTSMEFKLALILEFVERGSLRGVLDERKDLQLNIRISILDDVAQGLAYLCSRPQPIQHKDLKPDNILITTGWRAKVSDFGLSASEVTLSSATGGGHGGGTILYMSPEVHDAEADFVFTEKSDVYSYGMCMWECFTGNIPFLGLLEKQIRRKVCDKDERPELTDPALQGVDDTLVKLIGQCWAPEPAVRPTFNEIKEVIKPLSKGVGHFNKDGSIVRKKLEIDLKNAQAMTLAVEEEKIKLEARLEEERKAAKEKHEEEQRALKLAAEEERKAAQEKLEEEQQAMKLAAEEERSALEARLEEEQQLSKFAVEEVTRKNEIEKEEMERKMKEMKAELESPELRRGKSDVVEMDAGVLWERVKDEAGVEEGTAQVLVGDAMGMAMEGIFLEGDDCDAMDRAVEKADKDKQEWSSKYIEMEEKLSSNENELASLRKKFLKEERSKEEAKEELDSKQKEFRTMEKDFVEAKLQTVQSKGDYDQLQLKHRILEHDYINVKLKLAEACANLDDCRAIVASFAGKSAKRA
ncbi:hypothetical protein TeGR_g12095 [Tetraparma gracilis]|uniref:Protein kinase domain-containing protein n=1 Tax=Tetraparma gracilis TaxID=2962635 RepID=A0ABQ6MMY8_9STRA|nr:hypothetical protein TeGR_g12095 [Tetraparma gracilis]